VDMNLKQADSIIFDLDGTLWDAAEACAKAWNEALKQMGNAQGHVVDEVFIRPINTKKR
jgi:phosphoglycolate phosphatase